MDSGEGPGVCAPSVYLSGQVFQVWPTWFAVTQGAVPSPRALLDPRWGPQLCCLWEGPAVSGPWGSDWGPMGQLKPQSSGNQAGKRGSCLHVPHPPHGIDQGPPLSGPQTGTHRGLLGTKLHSRMKPAEGETKAISCPPSVETCPPRCRPLVPLGDRWYRRPHLCRPRSLLPRCWRPPIRMPSPV